MADRPFPTPHDDVDLTPYLAASPKIKAFVTPGDAGHIWARRCSTRRTWLRAWGRWRARRPRPDGRRYREFQTALWRWRQERPVYEPKPAHVPDLLRFRTEPAPYVNWDVPPTPSEEF